MSDKKLVKNNIDRFIGDLSGASIALSLIWKYAEDDTSDRKNLATHFLINEISAMAESLENYVSDAGDLSFTLREHKSEMDIHDILASKHRKEFSPKE